MEDDFYLTTGMTLGDWFAGIALQGMLSNPGDDVRGSYVSNSNAEAAAGDAYWYAAAMLKARRGGQE